MDRFIIDKKTNTLVGYRSLAPMEPVGYIVVPHQYRGQQIDRIGAHCFDGLRVQMLCVEEGVDFMEDMACEGASIQEVWLPRGLKMGSLCFAGSTLAKIRLPSDLDHLDTETFADCGDLTEISGLDSVRRIGFGAFEGCRGLERLELGNSVSWLDGFLFAGCASLRELELRGSFDRIEKDTFAEATALRYLTVETTAETFSFPSGGFRDTSLAEITLLGDFEPIVGGRDSFPENIVFRVQKCLKPQHMLGYTYDFLLTQDPSNP